LALGDGYADPAPIGGVLLPKGMAQTPRAL
jgi:hypothetical protein